MKQIIAAAFFLFSMVLAPAPLAIAATGNPLDDACQGVTGSPTCDSANNTKTDPLTGTNGTLMKVANVIAILTGIAAIVMIILAGIQYMTANGDAQKAATARKVIIGAIIGLVVIVSARLMISIVVNGVT